MATQTRTPLDSPSPELFVPPGAPGDPRLERIGVAYDGGPAAQRALAHAIDLVGLADGAVASLVIAYVDGGDAPPDEPGAPDRDAMIEWWLESQAEEVRAVVRPVRLAGDPATALADLSRDLDLLIVGTRPRGWLRRRVGRDVCAELLAKTHCALLVVPSVR